MLVVKFDKTNALNENLFNIVNDQDKIQEELHSRIKMLLIFQFFSKQNYSKLINLLTGVKNKNRDLTSRLIQIFLRN